MAYFGFLLCLGSIAAMATGDIRCPKLCTCERLNHRDGLWVDCSSAGLKEIPTDLDRETIHLDLSMNSIQRIEAGAFKELYKLAELKLEDNQIEDIVPFAFQGLSSVERVSLCRNSLSTIRENAFAELSGSAGVCGTGLRECRLDLRENPIDMVESSAFAWIRYLDVHIGNSDQELSISSYAFYGSSDFSHIEIGGVPQLNLSPRTFTNTERVSVLRFHGTRIPDLEEYHFQGLKQVQRIAFDNVEFENMESSAFSVVDYTIGGWRPHAVGKHKVKDTDNMENDDDDLNDVTRFIQCGGSVSFMDCKIPLLPPDVFQDTNLARVSIRGSEIDTIESYAFRGMHCLQSLTLRENKIDALEPRALGDLRNVHQVSLVHNTLEVFPSDCFKGSKDLRSLHVTLPDHLHVLLESRSFSDVHNVGEVHVRGEAGATLTIQPDALVNLVGVHKLSFSRLNLQTLGLRSLHGLAKVRSLRIQKCNVSAIHPGAFGSVQTSGIEHMHLGSVDCTSCRDSEALQEFGRIIKRFSASCKNGENYAFYQQHCSTTSGGARSTTTTNFSILFLFVLFLL